MKAGEMMDLRRLETFVAVVEEGSLSAASRRCNLSQPALSQQMQALEEDLGEALLIRRPRGVEPTAAGELLLRHARVMLAQAATLRGDFAGRRELETGMVRFGIIPTIAPYLLPQVLAPFQRAHPGIMIAVEEARTPQLIERTVAGEIEFAILSDVTPAERKRGSLQMREMFRETLLLAAPAGHRLAVRADAPKPSELDADELIYLSDGHCLAEQMLRLCRIRPSNPRLQCDQLATALALVSSGLGVTVVPQLAARDHARGNVVFRAFAGDGLFRVISLMRRRGAKPSPAADRLLAHLTRSETITAPTWPRGPEDSKR
jgi:LysR family hydrogen peroxide-inducible transcriptional activator